MNDANTHSAIEQTRADITEYASLTASAFRLELIRSLRAVILIAACTLSAAAVFGFAWLGANAAMALSLMNHGYSGTVTAGLLTVGNLVAGCVLIIAARRLWGQFGLTVTHELISGLKEVIKQ